MAGFDNRIDIVSTSAEIFFALLASDVLNSWLSCRAMSRSGRPANCSTLWQQVKRANAHVNPEGRAVAGTQFAVLPVHERCMRNLLYGDPSNAVTMFVKTAANAKGEGLALLSLGSPHARW